MDLEQIHDRIEQLERRQDSIKNELKTCKIQVENEMEKRHIKLENRVSNNDDDIQLVKKIVFGVIGVISLSVIYAWLNQVGL